LGASPGFDTSVASRFSLPRDGHHFEFFSPCFSSNERITRQIIHLSQERRKSGLKVSCYSSFGVRAWISNGVPWETLVAEALTLQRFYDLGSEVAWCCYLQTNHILVDRKIAYTDEKDKAGSFRAVPIDLLVSRLPSTQGYFRPIKGKVVLIEELPDMKQGEVDLFVRLEEEGNSQGKQNGEQSKGTISSLGSPIFLHSEWLPNQLDYGDTIRVSGIVNFTGEGILGGYAPAELFYEGISVGVLAKGNPAQWAHCRRFRFRDEVENLINNDPRFSSQSQHLTNRKKRDEWIIRAFKEIKKIIKAQGLVMQPSDDSFIMHELNDRLTERVTQAERLDSFEVMKRFIRGALAKIS